MPYDTVINGEQRTVARTKTVTEPTGEWRGLLKRDFGVHLLAGHSFGGDGYAQAMLAYNFRQGAFADQIIFSIDGGYNIPVAQDWVVTPKVLFDYTGGVGNGAVPDSSDRFQFRVPGTGEPRKNYYFNNGRYGRLYGSAAVTFSEKYTFDIGVGRWIFGDGSAVYWETYGQLTYAF